MKTPRSRAVISSLAGLVLSVGPIFRAEAPAQDAPTPPGQLTPIELLGRSIVRDTTLSSPSGQGCVSCHSPDTGFTGPDSAINRRGGPMPGATPGRFGRRKPPTYAYSVFSPEGITYSDAVQAYVGGQFWDGRAADLAAQAKAPFVDPNEMNNIAHGVADPALVVRKVRSSPYAPLFRDVFGRDAFDHPATQAYAWIAEACAAYEASPEVSPFSSKYDAVRSGKAAFTASERNGLRLYSGSMTGRPGGPASPKNALCFKCHGIPTDPADGPDLFSNYCYANIGIPRNPDNPYYRETGRRGNPLGYNPLGAAYVDLGLGDFYYPTMNLPAGNVGPGSNGLGDFLGINGAFRAQTLRNVDKRPNPRFVKAYMHNGAFKSLKQVVHFYNTRNLTTVPGEVIDFTAPDPYGSIVGMPLWPAPEYASPSSLQNPTGAPGSADVANQVGNLGLTDREEDDLVAFLGTLSDGYFRPDEKARAIGREALAGNRPAPAPMTPNR